jgi:hypothetical protein
MNTRIPFGRLCRFGRRNPPKASLGEVVPRQLDIRRADVLFKPAELCGTGDRHDPRLLLEQPRDRDLRGSSGIESAADKK